MRLIDIPAIADILGLNAAHVRDRLTKRRDFPAGYRIGGVLRWKAEDIEDWIEARKVTPAARRSTRRVRGSTSSTRLDSSAQTSAPVQAVAESSTIA